MGGVASDAGRRRILVVDDVELNRTLTEAVLRGATYEVDSVGDGESALAALETRRYDLVLMDLDMPGLHGHDAAAAIRRRQNGGVKLAALSSHRESSDIRRSGEVGMAAHIVRPIAPGALLCEIERVFRLPVGDASPPFDDPWQRKAYDDWASRLGAERMEGVLHALRDQLEALLLLTFEDDDQRLRRLAHDVASTAGMLGFLEVMRGCRAVQEAEPDDIAPTGAALRPTLEAAIARIARHFSGEASAAQAA